MQSRHYFPLQLWLALALSCAHPALSQSAAPSGWQEDSQQARRVGTNSNYRSLATTSRPAGQSSKFTLKGQVQHSDRLDPTSEELRPGLDFRASTLPTVRETSEWYRVPEWFAGTFKIEEAVVVKSYDYLTGRTAFLNQKLQSQGEETHGHQKDARLDIWHLSTTSGTSRSEDASHFMYNIIHWCGPEEIGEGRVVMRILATTVVVGKKTGKVDGVFRREDIKTYVPIKPGVVSISYTSKSFNTDGIPHDMQTGFSVHKQIAKFKPVNQLGDTDLAELFRQFLVSNGLSKLVPSLLQKGSSR